MDHLEEIQIRLLKLENFVQQLAKWVNFEDELEVRLGVAVLLEDSETFQEEEEIVKVETEIPHESEFNPNEDNFYQELEKPDDDDTNVNKGCDPSHNENPVVEPMKEEENVIESEDDDAVADIADDRDPLSLPMDIDADRDHDDESSREEFAILPISIPTSDSDPATGQGSRRKKPKRKIPKMNCDMKLKYDPDISPTNPFVTLTPLTLRSKELVSVGTVTRPRNPPPASLKGQGRKFNCPFCPWHFKSLAHMKSHLPTHTGERPFKCLASECSFATAHKHALKVHILKKHPELEVEKFKLFSKKPAKITKNKMYKCPHCLMRMKSRTAITSHLRTHTGERPFKCPQGSCTYAATTKGTLKTHILAKHKKEKLLMHDEEISI